MLTVVETTTGWLEMCPVPHPTARIPSWASKSKSCGDMEPQKEVSQTVGLIDPWAREHNI